MGGLKSDIVEDGFKALIMKTRLKYLINDTRRSKDHKSKDLEQSRINQEAYGGHTLRLRPDGTV